MRVSAILPFLALFFLAISPAFAQDAPPSDKKYVTIRLLPERATIKAGDEIWIGVEQSIAPDWHTYWVNPGDSGSTARIEWHLPEGFQVGDISWPAPRKIPYGPLTNYGYSDQTILLQKLMVPDTLPEGPVRIDATIDILVCNEICIPESGTYSITLNDPNNTTENNAAYLKSVEEALPIAKTWDASFHEQDGKFVLSVTTEGENLEGHEGLAFFPYDWGLVENSAVPEFEVKGDKLVMRQKRGERKFDDIDRTAGLITFTSNGEMKSFSIIAGKGAAPAATEMTPPDGANNWWKAALLAFLGGLVLNLMPCVFPVLSIKALSLVKYASHDHQRAHWLGLSYTAGVILSFLAIAGLLIIIKGAGAHIGWGFQLQNPIVVALLAYMLFMIGLNLMGMFEISGHFGNWGNKLTKGTGLTSSFFTGVLATLVATPCTAPFMAAALGYALTQAPIANLSIFAALGLGLAFPYLLLSYVPALQARLPKPGAWMNSFRQLLAFPMFISAVWLVWVLAQQAGAMSVFSVLLGMVAIAFGFWLLSHKPKTHKWRAFVIVVAAISFITAVAMVPLQGTQEVAKDEHLSMGEPYAPDKLANLLLSDDPIFVEMTAAWCITCKLNHAVAIDTEDTRTLFAQKNVHYLVGDWTSYDPVITDYLNSFGRDGVPLYIYYGPRDIVTGIRPEPIIMKQILTPGLIADTIGRF